MSQNRGTPNIGGSPLNYPQKGYQKNSSIPLKAFLLSQGINGGIQITRELQPDFAKRNDEPVEGLEERRKQLRLLNKASKKGAKKK